MKIIKASARQTEEDISKAQFPQVTFNLRAQMRFNNGNYINVYTINGQDFGVNLGPVNSVIETWH
jgi:hypothetical protein